MAPRGRGRKVGLKRMDAAIDALKPMGYSAEFTTRKVKELLEVYGEEGWPFIEEASYKALIEYILEEDGDGKGEPSTAQIEDKERSTSELEASQAEPSSDAIEPLCSTQDELLLSPITVLTLPLPLPETPISPTNDETRVEHRVREKSIYEIYMPQVHPPKVRKPCLGWIGPNTNEDDFVLLKPAPFQGWKTSEQRRKRKRKSGWDVRPDDIV